MTKSLPDNVLNDVFNAIEKSTKSDIYAFSTPEALSEDQLAVIDVKGFHLIEIVIYSNGSSCVAPLKEAYHEFEGRDLVKQIALVTKALGPVEKIVKKYLAQ